MTTNATNADDMAAFDGHMSEIERLRATSGGRVILEALERGLAAVGKAALATGEVLAPIALEALKGYAISLATAEIGKLGGKRGG